jgi:hypothetical protein
MVAASGLLPTIKTFTTLLKPHCVELHVCGSMRRGKPDVKDVELVLLPDKKLLKFLDELVEDGRIEKALYGGKPRWGNRYRGMIFGGVKFEMFVFDGDNRGYQMWMRTGPGDANTIIMSALGQRKAPFGFQTWGYFGTREWKKGKLEFTPDLTRKLRLNDERDMFVLFGLPYIEPQDRSIQTYSCLLNARGHTFGDPAQFLIEQVQPLALFDDAPAAQVPSSKRLDDIDLSNVPLYDGQSKNTYAAEFEILQAALEALGDPVGPTEDEVCLFAERRYTYWLRQQWKAAGL